MPIVIENGGGQLGSATSGNNVAITPSPAPLENQYLVLMGGHSHEGGNLAGPNEAGYTTVFVETFLDGDTDGMEWGLWYKLMGGTPDTVVTGLGSGNSRHATVYVALVLSGVDLVTFLDVAHVLDTTPTNLDPPSITPITPGALIIIGSSDFDDTNQVTGHPLYTNVLDATVTESVRYQFGIASRLLAVAAAEDPAPFNINGTPNLPQAVTIAVRPATDAPAPSGARKSQAAVNFF